MLGKAERVIILANNARTHETLRNRILLPEIRRFTIPAVILA
jgi:hypothetical protein